MAAAYQNLPRDEINFERLNSAERQVLRMLAEGHTAKSIANAIGSTPAAVNEGLREARRKTAVGSIRELARLVRQQENRHEEIGVGRAHPVRPILRRPDVARRRRKTGVIAMIGLSLVVAAGAVALMSQQPAAESTIDPLIGTPLPRGPEPAELHAKLRVEPRDQQWARPMERHIEARVMSLPLVGKHGNILRVTCASSLCEIAGTLLTPVSNAEREDQNSQFNRTVKDLQVPPLTDDLMRLGLNFEAGTFTSGEGKPDRVVFLLYYSRKEAKPK